MDREEAVSLVESYPTWHQKYEIYPGVMTLGAYDPLAIWTRINFDKSVKGLEVLDIGACDGFFAREMHRMGAKVTAFDYRSKTFSGFGIMEKLYGHEIDHIHANISDISSLGLSEYDLVLFLGVLYHLPDPVRSLWDIAQVCRGEIWLETYTEEFDSDLPLARYYKAATLAGDMTNFWAPNRACVAGMLEDAGFQVISDEPWGDRALFHARRVVHPRDNAKMQTAYGLLKTDRD